MKNQNQNELLLTRMNRDSLIFYWKNRKPNDTKSINFIQKAIFAKYQELCSKDEHTSESSKKKNNKKSQESDNDSEDSLSSEESREGSSEKKNDKN